MSGRTAAPHVPEWTLGDRLTKARELAGLDQAHMARHLGVSRVSISNWERDEARPRDVLTMVRRWSELTGVAEDWLLGLRTGRTEAGTGTSPLDVVTAGEPFDDLSTVLDQRRYHYAGNAGDPSRR